MSKRCAKCEKTVYPIEELKCLDKIWHKGCFKCESCGMTLNMKNYKGYDKLPYCNAHYPTTKFTAVADTPEFARIAQNSKIQSNLQYHAEFEKSKGKYTAVTDDPELLRAKANSAKFSSVQYHEEFEKSKGKYTQVADDPEMQRIRENTKNISLIQYHSDFNENLGKYTSVADDPETLRILKNQQNISQIQYHSDFNENLGKYTAVADDPETLRILKNQQNISQIKYHEDFEKNIKGTKTNVVDDPETVRLQQQSKLVSQVEYHGLKKKHDEMERHRASVGDDVQPTQISRRPESDYNAGGDQVVPSPYTAKFSGHSTTYGAGGKAVKKGGNPAKGLNPAKGAKFAVEHSQPKRNIGSISDYDPMKDNWGSLNKGYHPPSSTGRTQQWEETIPQVPRQQNNQEYNHGHAPPSPRQQQQTVPMVPVNQPLALMVHHPEQQEPQQQPAYYPPPQQQSPRHSYQQQSPRNSYQQQQQSPRQSYQQQSPRNSYQQQQQSPRQAAPPPRKTPLRKRGVWPPRKGPLFQAMYDYEAQDDDEIGFCDGDVIIDTEPIDEGWMYGTVERTGKRGMLPANYVERVQ